MVVQWVGQMAWMDSSKEEGGVVSRRRPHDHLSFWVFRTKSAYLEKTTGVFQNRRGGINEKIRNAAGLFAISLGSAATLPS